MSELHPFLQSIRDEHKFILTTLSSLQANLDWPHFFQFCRAQVQEHEKLEELFLFTAIASKEEIKAGGPYCMLYYGLHLQNPPLNAAASACCEPSFDPRKNLNSTRKPFFEMNSPVCIPVEDHMALEQILKKVEQNADALNIIGLASLYMRILKSHFEKEDSCLLPMCQSILTEVELDLCLAKAETWKEDTEK
jgi:hemerythrin superfamily protein